MSTGVIIGIAVVIFIIIGGAAWYFLLGPGSTSSTSSSDSSSISSALGSTGTTSSTTGTTASTGSTTADYFISSMGTKVITDKSKLTGQRADWNCGPSNNNAQCPKGTWCSAYQVCGTTDEHKYPDYMIYSNP